jgi:dTMP kinase
VTSLLITVEGVEGSGKSTQSERLADRLRGRGHRVTLTSEPDGTPLGLAVRAVFDAAGPPPTPLAQALLFMAARQQHVAHVIRPALARDEIVISDRYTDATLAYQGHGQGLDLQTIRELNLLATGGVLPDLTLLLDLDPAAGMERIGGRPLDAFERMGLDFHRRVRQGYLDVAAAEKERVVVLDAGRPPEVLERDMARAVEVVLGRREKPRGA